MFSAYGVESYRKYPNPLLDWLVMFFTAVESVK